MTRRSGITVPFTPNGVPLPWPQQARLVASYESQGGPTTPLTLLVDTRSHSVGDESGLYQYLLNGLLTPGYRTVRRTVELPAGLSPYGSGRPGGALIVTYGSGGTERRLVCDLRGGSYAIPPCETARVEAVVWQDGVSLEGFSVSATFVDGAFPSPSRFTHTYAAQKSTDAGLYEGLNYFSLTIPDGARWMQLWASSSSEVVRARLDQYGARVTYDFAASTAPIDPIELPVAGEDGVLVSHDASKGSVSVRFFLEP